MASVPTGAPAYRANWAGIWTFSAGVLALASFFVPWLTIYFSADTGSQPVVETPFVNASTDPASQSTWVLLLTALVLLYIGAASTLLPQHRRRWGVLRIAACAALVLAMQTVLGGMAFWQFLAGLHGVGVHQLPQLGLFIAGLSLCAAVVGALRR